MSAPPPASAFARTTGRGAGRFTCARCSSAMRELYGRHVLPAADRYPPLAQSTWCDGVARELVRVHPATLEALGLAPPDPALFGGSP